MFLMEGTLHVIVSLFPLADFRYITFCTGCISSKHCFAVADNKWFDAALSGASVSCKSVLWRWLAQHESFLLKLAWNKVSCLRLPCSITLTIDCPAMFPTTVTSAWSTSDDVDSVDTASAAFSTTSTTGAQKMMTIPAKTQDLSEAQRRTVMGMSRRIQKEEYDYVPLFGLGYGIYGWIM